MQKKHVIVYGLGMEYEKQKYFIEDEWSIVCYADKKEDKPMSIRGGQLYILPSEISKQSYEYIYITTEKFAEEIEEELISKYNIPQNKILKPKDAWWYVKNAEYRHEWIKKELAKLPKGSCILDAGAGNMRYKKYCGHLQYKAQDFGQYDPYSEGKWHSRSVDIICDITSIPLENESQDCVLCTEVLEHVKEPIAVIKEFSRLLRKGGVLLLTVPFCCPTHMEPFFFSNGFSKFWYEVHLKEQGFKIEEIVSIGNWFSYVAQELERFPEICKKYGIDYSLQDMKTIMNCVNNFIIKSKNDEQSSEFLCFGYLVKAVRT